MFLIIDIYRLGVVYPYLSTSISLDECDYYRYISHIIINVINNDEEIYIAIYLPKKFPDVSRHLKSHLDKIDISTKKQADFMKKFLTQDTAEKIVNIHSPAKSVGTLKIL